jgi:hypothetical protein
MLVAANPHLPRVIIANSADNVRCSVIWIGTKIEAGGSFAGFISG